VGFTINQSVIAMQKIYRSLPVLSALLLTFLTASCQPTAAPATEAGGYENLTVAQFKEKMDSPEVVVLDVRTPAETAAGKIAGAQELDFKAPNFQEAVGQLDKDKTYLVYCRSGGRSSAAASMMTEMGFTKVYNLTGGYLAWEKE